MIQPIAFNHKAHQDAAIECGYCHGQAASFDSAGIPRISDCADCHAGIDNEGKEAAKLFAYLERKEEPPWQALFVVKKWNRFSHKAHIKKGVECAVCHAGIGSSVTPPARRVEYDMGWCMDCHREKRASNDCLVCHK